MTRITIIANPTSGGGEGAADLPALEALLTRRGVDYSIFRTERPWHAAELARQAAREGCGLVAAMGGDGTANEVINGLMQAGLAGEGNAAFGLIAVGRGNDFGYSIGVPHGLEESCEVLLCGRRARIDIGRFTGGLFPEGRFFANGIGIGFDAAVCFEVARLTPLTRAVCRLLAGVAGALQRLKTPRSQPRTGSDAYNEIALLAAVLNTVFVSFQPPLVKIETDSGAREQRVFMVSVMNGRRMGGSFRMAPESRNDDGLLTVCTAGRVGKLEIFRLLPRFIQGTQAGHPAIRFEQTRRIRVTAMRGSLPAHADGETLCTEGETIAVEAIPAALEVVCGKADA